MLCCASVPQTSLRTFEPIGWFQQKNRAFKEENLIQVSGQPGKGKGPLFSSSPCYSHRSQPLGYVWLIMFWLYRSFSLRTLSLPLKLPPPPAEHFGCAIQAVLYTLAARKFVVKILHTRHVRAISVLGDKIPLLSTHTSH